MKWEVAVLAVFTLAGCSPDRQHEMVACKAQADRFYQSEINFDVSSGRSQYIIGCMAAKGYDFDVMPRDCDSRYPLPNQATCYVRGDWLNWILEKFGMDS